MKEINLNTWKRKQHFLFFNKMDYPQFNICFNIDITKFALTIKQKNLPFYYSMIYLSNQCVNAIEEFRYRMKDGKVVLYNIVHPSFSYMDKDTDLFSMITVEMKDNLNDFIAAAKKKSVNQKEYFIINDYTDRSDYVHYTSVPWIQFTHLSHTIRLDRNDAVPKISWGKSFEENSKIMLPYSVQVNHMFADGIHIGKFKEELERRLKDLAF